MSEDVARQTSDSTSFNTLNVPTVELRFQRGPGVASGQGIAGLSFRVTAGGAVIQLGTTDKDGRVRMLVPGGAARLELISSAGTVAYDVTLDPDPVAPIGEPTGQQQRLRLLGYQIGRGGASKDGVTGKRAAPTGARQTPTAADGALDGEDMKFERGILDFQVDAGRIPGNASILDRLAADAGV